MSKKLKTCRGASIAEMLIAVVLLALLTAGGITVAAGVMASYNRMKEAANADILASTVIEAISNEVRLGRKLDSLNEDAPADSVDETLQLDSAFWGEGAKLKLDDSGRLVALFKDASGETTKPLLSDDTYGSLHLYNLVFAVPADSQVCTFSFAVRNGSDQELWTGSASASPLQ